MLRTIPAICCITQSYHLFFSYLLCLLFSWIIFMHFLYHRMEFFMFSLFPLLFLFVLFLSIMELQINSVFILERVRIMFQRLIASKIISFYPSQDRTDSCPSISLMIIQFLWNLSYVKLKATVSVLKIIRLLHLWRLLCCLFLVIQQSNLTLVHSVENINHILIIWVISLSFKIRVY